MSEYYKKYIKYKNKYINLQIQMGGAPGPSAHGAPGDQPLPVTRNDSFFDTTGKFVPSNVPRALRSESGSYSDLREKHAAAPPEAELLRPVRAPNPYSYDHAAIDKANELAEAQDRIANRNNEDKHGLFKEAVKKKDDEKKDEQNKPYRVSNNRWPYPEIIERRKKDYEIVEGIRPTTPEVLTPVRAANPDFASYDILVKMKADALVDALVRIENRANEDIWGREQVRIINEKVAMNQPVRGGESRRSWPWPEVIEQREEDNKLVEDNKEFLEENREFLEGYNLYPTI